MKFLSVEEFQQLPCCSSCHRVMPTLVLETHGYCINCAIGGGQVYNQSAHYDLPPYVIDGISIVCTICGTKDPEITRYGLEWQVSCDNCPVTEEE